MFILKWIDGRTGADKGFLDGIYTDEYLAVCAALKRFSDGDVDKFDSLQIWQSQDGEMWECPNNTCIQRFLYRNGLRIKPEDATMLQQDFFPDGEDLPLFTLPMEE